MANQSTSLLMRVAALGLAPVLAILMHSEGRVNKVYTDPVGIKTVCDGHTGAGLVPGKTYSPEECDAFLLGDLKSANAVVDSCVHVPLTPNQRAALVDFAFNLGPGGRGVKDGMCSLKSGAVPTITKLFNQRRYDEACREFPKWNAQKLPGITKRRNSEMELCLKP